MSQGLLAAHVHPACLPMHGQTFGLNDTCWITGFGKTKETDGEGQVLDSVCVCVCVCTYMCVCAEGVWVTCWGIEMRVHRDEALGV